MPPPQKKHGLIAPISTPRFLQPEIEYSQDGTKGEKNCRVNITSFQQNGGAFLLRYFMKDPLTKFPMNVLSL